MIIIRTPLRVSFFGGGTDFPEWYNKHGGCVVSVAIDKYCYIQIRELKNFFDHKYRIRYFYNEECNDINNIKHPVVRSVLQKYYKKKNGLEIIHNADLPARTGLGSSSAFTATLINSIYHLNSKNLSKKNLLKETLNVEQNILRESVGSQDQAACIMGGFNFIKFSKDNIQFENLYKSNSKKLNNLRQHLSLFFIGFHRNAKKIEEDKIKKISKNISLYRDLIDLTIEGRKLIKSLNPKNFLKEFAMLLNYQWNIKKRLSEQVSNTFIDNFYNYGLKNGATAGKILGAGSGGFFLFLSDTKKNKVKLINKLKKNYCIDFNYDFEGSKKIY
jgi:D-glycero-alpha-D-manno-heptose-7-phosphate kinase